MFIYTFHSNKRLEELFNIYGAIIDLLPPSKAVKGLSACYFSTICSTPVPHHVSFLLFRGRTFVRIPKQKCFFKCWCLCGCAGPQRKLSFVASPLVHGEVWGMHGWVSVSWSVVMVFCQKMCLWICLKVGLNNFVQSLRASWRLGAPVVKLSVFLSQSHFASLTPICAWEMGP